MFTRLLLVAAFGLLGSAPAGLGVGFWLAAGVGWGVAAGSVGYAAVAVFMLTADLLPDPPREVTR